MLPQPATSTRRGLIIRQPYPAQPSGRKTAPQTTPQRALFVAVAKGGAAVLASMVAPAAAAPLWNAKISLA
jgi:hypothetical protein